MINNSGADREGLLPKADQPLKLHFKLRNLNLNKTVGTLIQISLR